MDGRLILLVLICLFFLVECDVFFATAAPPVPAAQEAVP